MTGRGFTGSAAAPSSSSVVFLFSGQGSQYPNMGADLYASEPVFRDCLDQCAEQLRPHLGLDLREVLYPSAENPAAAAEQLNRTSITQPALFSVEYSLAQWWMAHGVRPQAMVGHSIGEYVAACLADVLSLEDALAITAIRGSLMEECSPGSMLAVALSREDIPLSRTSIDRSGQCAPAMRRFRASGCGRGHGTETDEAGRCLPQTANFPCLSFLDDGPDARVVQGADAPRHATSAADPLSIQSHRHLDYCRRSD